jgi:hypothetical protein
MDGGRVSAVVIDSESLEQMRAGRPRSGAIAIESQLAFMGSNLGDAKVKKIGRPMSRPTPKYALKSVQSVIQTPLCM